jgi:hypothetical protein
MPSLESHSKKCSIANIDLIGAALKWHHIRVFDTQNNDLEHNQVTMRLLSTFRCSFAAARLSLPPIYIPATTTTRRQLLSQTAETPIGSSVTERPCTVVLAEDVAGSFYKESWHAAAVVSIPQDHGMTYHKWSLSPSVTTMDEALSEMKRDLAVVQHDAVLVARGPWMSWMAQFYLESLPLKGLVMVDPIPLDSRNDANLFELQYKKLGLETSLEFRLFQEFAEHWGHWSLQLEMGSVPMLVIQSMDRPAFRKAAEATARRHGSKDSQFGPVPILKLLEGKENTPQDATNIIGEWIVDQVL